jgi:site-specific DNA-methyltransferase (adenine-specific)
MEISNNYNPDVLTCLANLSNDEVFTPPALVNQILDLLPSEIWKDKNATFLDPACKSGVFLREIAKRLNEGLKPAIPNLQKRLNHIYQKQLFGLPITELTALLSRRSVYCSKIANGKYSVCETFNDSQGNLKFERVEHDWKSGRCSYCGATQEGYDRGDALETHAYKFIHTDQPEEIFKMKFDVIIGNPPYQIDADEAGANIVPIYNKFVTQAKALKPRFMTMIVPSRWMAGGKWLDEFRAEMLRDKSVRVLVDYPNAAEAFPGVDIKGGVCFFLWNRDEKGMCAVTTKRGDSVVGPVKRNLDEFDVFVRDSRALDILYKVLNRSEKSLKEMVSPRDPFGSELSSNFKNYHAKKQAGDLWLYINQAEKRGETWIKPSIVTKNHHLIDAWKVLVPKAGPGNSGGHVIPDMVLSKPLVAKPGSVCTLSYLVVGPLKSEKESESLASYLRTRFIRFLVSLRKTSQDAPRGVYTWVPQQSWDREWTDEALYAKYKFTKKEITFIESMVRPMELAND